MFHISRKPGLQPKTAKEYVFANPLKDKLEEQITEHSK